MKLVEGRLDYAAGWERPDVYVFTGNPIRRKDGAVVMGRGAAKEVRDNYPTVPYAIGEYLKARPYANLALANVGPEQDIIWFKVKHHWRADADLALIYDSAYALGLIARLSEETTYHMNFPGVGNGRLRYEDVLPILEKLPDNVLIYIEKKEVSHV